MTQRRSQRGVKAAEAAQAAEAIQVADAAEVVETPEAAPAAEAVKSNVVETSEPMDYSHYPDTVDGIEEEALDDDYPYVPVAKTPAEKVEKTLPEQQAVEKSPEPESTAEAPMEEDVTEEDQEEILVEEEEDEAQEEDEEAQEKDEAPVKEVVDVMMEGDDDANISGNPPIPGLHIDRISPMPWEEELLDYHVPTLYEVEDAVGPDYRPYIFRPRVEPPEFIWSVGELAKERIQVLKEKHSLSKRKHRVDFCIFCLDFKLKSGLCSTEPDPRNHDRFQNFWLKEYPHEEVLTKQIVLADLENIAEVWV